VKSVGGWASEPRNRGRILERPPYCKSCWVDWHLEQHRRNHTCIVTLHAARIPEPSDTAGNISRDEFVATGFKLACFNMAGDEIWTKCGEEAEQMSLGAVRAALQQVLSLGDEKRLARDGLCYSEDEFVAFYGSSWQWDKAPPSLNPLIMISADGSHLNEHQDKRLVSSLSVL